MGISSGHPVNKSCFQSIFVVFIFAIGCQPNQLAEKTNNKPAQEDITSVNSGLSDSITFYDTINTDDLLRTIKEPECVHHMGFFQCDIRIEGLSNLDRFSKLESITLDTIRDPIEGHVFSALSRIKSLKSLVLKQSMYDRFKLIDYVSKAQLLDLVLFEHYNQPGGWITEVDIKELLAHVERLNVNGKVFQRVPALSIENPDDSFGSHWQQR